MPQGAVRTFAGRTSAILGTRSAQPALYPSRSRFLSLSLPSSRFFFSLRHVYVHVLYVCAVEWKRFFQASNESEESSSAMDEDGRGREK